MAQLKQCDRCKKNIDEKNEIGIVIGISKFKVDRGYIRPSKTFLGKVEEIQYFPIEFKNIPNGEIDLCTKCFDDFFNLNKQV